MNREEKLFIRILADYVNSSNTPEIEGSDWAAITKIAKEQILSGIVYAQCHKLNGIPDAQMKALREGFFSDVYLSINSEYAMAEVLRAFAKERIDAMPFKGSIFCHCYPDPELRTMGDRDILIRHKDREKSDRIMQNLGYQKMVDNHAVWTYYKKNLMFEIHDVMFYEHLANQMDYTAYFSRVWNTAIPHMTGSCIYEPDPQLHFLYLVTHTAKHVINSGMGFRAFLDMALYCKYYENHLGQDVDWNWIETELHRLKLYEFAGVCFTLCEKWFDVKMPFAAELKDGFYEKVTQKMFKDGVFGLTNEENVAARSTKEIKRAKDNYYLTALKLTIYKLFPSYSDMQLIPWYSWVDGRPYLLPLAWVYRWGYCLKNKAEHSLKLVLEPVQKKKMIEEREVFLSNWGL